MEPETLDKILKALKRAHVSEFSLKQEGMELSIRFESNTAPVQVVTAPQVAYAPQVVQAAAPAPQAAAPAPQAPAPAAAPAKEYRVIKAPIVGTFYRSPSPDAAPYIKVGDSVRKGQVVCIVEAMKLMNQIESDVDGVVAEILIENGQPVQFGQELFRLTGA